MHPMPIEMSATEGLPGTVDVDELLVYGVSVDVVVTGAIVVRVVGIVVDVVVVVLFPPPVPEGPEERMLYRLIVTA